MGTIFEENAREDYMIRATAAGTQLRAFAVTGRELTETARQAHNCSPIATAALGRSMCGALMMADMLKGPDDMLTLKIDGDGPMGGLLVTADNKGNVKGYVKNGDVNLPPNAQGHLNVGGANGRGTLTVIRDLGLKDPYVGQVALRTGEIAEDLTYYYAESEQIPSAVGLGVLMNKNNTVRQAGGFIIQLMPFTDEEVIVKLEENLRQIDPVTTMLEKGHTPEKMLEQVLDGFDIDYTERQPVRFYCNCSKERCERGLILLGEEEIKSIIEDGKAIDMNCHFCGKQYTFTVEDLKKILPRTKVNSRMDIAK